ncbi:tetrapyrrole methylase family protein / MazG family protein [Acetomicrobium thermoterrenum DSM 13490]|uniref:Tetrapyrrole methylase family protein / MazG family protein n=1 Tax=Acetomicrobium thermoterrenum DSM 13490 TaxID=1120987 RepID=A0A1H3DQM9_9BACT|nr:nucleoside triphosphate pyrophosphohydrolase [Acetomicrobium thermoterrenum]SDX68640.1 tetrapyrrole methylase family protein / MazG family protein [Acetomicrobium thermoterrenum DSM 13490]
MGPKRHIGGSFEELVEIMKKLRAPGGCPWDRKQTLEMLKEYVIEESYELIDAIDSRDVKNICEECGDLLLQIVFIAQIAAENDWFDVQEIIESLCDKLKRRHPHVFGDLKVRDSEEVRRNWDMIKLQERESKKEEPSRLTGIPRSMPALLRAYAIQERAAKVGFDWEKGNLDPIWAKLDEEIRELRKALDEGDAGEVKEEIGDLLFAVVNLSRHIGVNPEEALQGANEKFSARFRFIEKSVEGKGRSFDEYSLDELETLWQSAKKAQRTKGRLIFDGQ